MASSILLHPDRQHSHGDLKVPALASVLVDVTPISMSWTLSFRIVRPGPSWTDIRYQYR